MPPQQTWVWLRVECFSLESWVDLNRKWGTTLSHESIWTNTWGIHLSSVDSESIPRKSLKSWVESIKSSKSCLSHELFRIKALESNAQKRSYKCNTSVESPKTSTKSSESPKTSTKSSESPKTVNENEWKPEKGQQNEQLIRVIETWLDSNQYSR